MPIEADPASRPIPRPARGDNVRLIRALFSDPPVALDEIHATYGPICGLGVGPMQVVVVGGPELIGQVHSHESETVPVTNRPETAGPDRAGHLCHHADPRRRQ